MNQLQFYKIALLLLALLNIGTIAFITFRPHPPPPHLRGETAHSFLQKAIEILELDAEQENTFKQLAEQHNEQLKSIESQQAESVESYFHTIVDNNSTLQDSLMRQLQQLEQNKIVLTYKHFEEVKSILKTAQQKNFQPFLDDALRILLINSKNNPLPPKP